jgi:phosphoglycolate phosphatase-like HAD superfamily hydrolase
MNLAFDLDGTLISCEPRQSAVLQAALQRWKVQADLSEVWNLKRNGASTQTALVQMGMEQNVAERVAETWRQMIENPVWLGLDTVLGGVLEVLGDMRAKGVQAWLVTARSHGEWVPQQLQRLGLMAQFNEVVVVSAHEAAAAKAAVLRNLSAVAFFGDTESDWLAAKTAAVPFYAVTSGQRSAAFLERAGLAASFAGLAGAWRGFLKDKRLVF